MLGLFGVVVDVTVVDVRPGIGGDEDDHRVGMKIGVFFVVIGAVSAALVSLMVWKRKQRKHKPDTLPVVREMNDNEDNHHNELYGNDDEEAASPLGIAAKATHAPSQECRDILLGAGIFLDDGSVQLGSPHSSNGSFPPVLELASTGSGGGEDDWEDL